MRHKIWFWWLRNFPTGQTYTCNNDRMDNFKIGDIYVETTNQQYIKIGKNLLWIKQKKALNG